MKKLLDGKSNDYKAFIWNRALRLLELLMAVILFIGMTTFASGGNLAGHATSIAYGVLLTALTFFFHSARFVDGQIMDISNFHMACLWSLVCFMLILMLAYVSFRFIEAPFLKPRKSYITMAHTRHE